MAINAPGTRTRGRHEFKFVAIDENTADTFALVAAPILGKRIVIMSIRLNCAAAEQTCTFKSGTDALFGALATAAGGSIEWADNDVGLAACDASTALNLTTGHASQVSGLLSYVIEDAL